MPQPQLARINVCHGSKVDFEIGKLNVR